MNILVVDDTEDARLILRKTLTAAGHQIEEAESGAQALDLARRRKPDLIISDILMPEMDGFQFCREVRGDEALKDTPFVFYTATCTDAQDERLALELGADRFIRKPMDGVSFLAAIKDVTREVARSEIVPSEPELNNETEFLKLYNERLIQKLEKKMADLEIAADALSVSEKRYRDLFDNTPDAIAVTTPDGRFLEVNQAFLDLFGYRWEELLDMNVADLYVNPADRQALVAMLGQKGFVRDLESGRRKKDGSRIICQASAFLRRKNNGGERSIQSITRDVTGLRKLEAQFRQAQKMEAVGRLAGGVAHDFNNMLSIILGYTESAMERLKTTDPLHADLLEVHTAAKRSADLTRQLLAFSRQQIIAPKPVDLNNQLKIMERMLRRILGEDIDLTLVLGPSLWPVLLDTSQFDLVVANLAVNARDAMPDGGRLTLETGNIVLDETYSNVQEGYAPGEYVYLAVNDSGCGMDKETLEHAFEPFFTTKEEGKGTGLGLATIYGIARQNKGFVNLYSEPGCGTSVKIYFPRHRHDGPVKAVAPGERKPQGGSETVLLVEDEAQLRKLAMLIMERLGYKVIAAAGPQQAITLCKEHQGDIHLLLTDVVLPTMNGKELSAEIKALRPPIRTLFMSGYTSNVIAHRGVLEPGTHFLQKPFSIQAIAKKIRDALDEVLE